MALTQDIKTDRYGTPDQAPPIMAQPIDANQTIFGGSVVITRAGFVVAASSPQSTDQVWGICDKQTVNQVGSFFGGARAATTVPIDRGDFWLAYGSAGDAFTQADVGSGSYLIDEQTVGKTNGGGTRPPSGVILAVDTTISKVAVALATAAGSVF